MEKGTRRLLFEHLLPEKERVDRLSARAGADEIHRREWQQGERGPEKSRKTERHATSPPFLSMDWITTSKGHFGGGAGEADPASGAFAAELFVPSRDCFAVEAGLFFGDSDALLLRRFHTLDFKIPEMGTFEIRWIVDLQREHIVTGPLQEF